MEHNEIVTEKISEKYLLNELPPADRERFEEHYFECQECALDVRSGMAFMEASKQVLAARAPNSIAVPERVAASRGLFSWLRPAFAFPVLALLLAVMGYQNLVTYPALKHQARADFSPALLPSLSLINANSRGASTAVLSLDRDQPFLLSLDIPSEDRFSSYEAQLNGQERTSTPLTIPAEATKNTVALRMPGLSHSGMYTLVVRGVTSSGLDRPEVASYPFELKIR